MYYACNCDHCGSPVAFPVSGLFGFYCDTTCHTLAEESAEKRRVARQKSMEREQTPMNTHVQLGLPLFA